LGSQTTRGNRSSRPKKTEPQPAGLSEHQSSTVPPITSQRSLNIEELPLIALVGRPNVGKSTLFNRLIHQRKSITDPTPGVTRDPVYSFGAVGSIPAFFVDTGGLTDSRDSLDQLITKKSLEVVDRAAIILFMVDVEEITAEDEEFIERLRPYSEKLILVVNKVDNASRGEKTYEFYSFGFSKIITLSAAHGLGIEELQNLLIDRCKALGFSPHDDLVQGLPEKPWDMSIALLGQPNTGKSTLANYLTGTNSSLVSPIAGTTRDIIEGTFSYKGKVFRILDTAGIRRKNKVTEDLEYYSVNRAFKTIDEADIVILLIDVEKGLVEQDKKIAAQIVKKGRGVILAANKWDTLEDTPNTLNAVTDRIRFLFPVLDFAPVVPLSALEGQGIELLLKTADTLMNQLQKRIETGPLNQALKRWVDKTPPPQNARDRWKIRYITQVSKHPVQFVLFVNKAKGFPEFYLGYLRNQLRKEFGFTQIPIQVELRARH
jgi:GTP-binding protein